MPPRAIVHERIKTSRRRHLHVVASTHRDLRELAHQGLFREDLFYRLAVFVLAVPGLDQRVEDIPALAAHFGARACGCRALSRRPLTLHN